MRSGSTLFGDRNRAARPAGDSDRDRLARHDEAELERENDAILEGVGRNVAALKAKAGEMQQETALHLQILDGLADKMRAGATGVRGTITRLDNAMATYGFKYTCTAAIALFCFVMIAWWIITKVRSK